MLYRRMIHAKFAADQSVIVNNTAEIQRKGTTA
jgi:hypothetical protein